MNKLRNDSINFIYEVFASDCKNDNILKFESDYFNKIIEESFKEIIKDKKPVEKPFLIRTAGQCGSGKTTQLLPSIKNNLKTDNFIHLAVRLFAKKHPYYKKLIEDFGEGLVREKTNGFALFCLFKILELLIKNKYNIFLEVTILDSRFEEYINKIAKNFNYSIFFNVMSVPFEVSNYLAEERTKNSSTEKNRIMPKNTLNIFNTMLSDGIENIIKNKNIFDEDDYFIIWSMKKSKPVLISNSFTEEILKIFNENRIFNEKDILNIPDFDKKLKEKNDFYKEFLNKNINKINI